VLGLDPHLHYQLTTGVEDQYIAPQRDHPIWDPKARHVEHGEYVLTQHAAFYQHMSILSGLHYSILIASNAPLRRSSGSNVTSGEPKIRSFSYFRHWNFY
jgi:hypothetical protein